MLEDQCTLLIRVRTFEEDIGAEYGQAEYNGYFQLLTKEDAIKEGWSNYSIGRGIYRSLKKPAKCIYCHSYGHWWVGLCNTRGLYGAGLAYLLPKKTCPYNGAASEWKVAGTDKMLKEFNVMEVPGESLIVLIKY